VDNTPRLSIISVNLLMPKSLFTFSLNILCNSFDLPVNVILQLSPDQVTHPSTPVCGFGRLQDKMSEVNYQAKISKN
jgi:hypothetical protein